ncbi:hypothetical protein ACK36Q_11955 [Aeromonas veronii]|uniref:hypothetical protein n=1 Tax=Aeromonas veronii TaxID=654 RepID=UPI00214D19F1|nr:hypothetical protein [Aeromonas veronii]
MKIDTNNIKDVDLKNHLHFKIVIVGTSNREGSERNITSTKIYSMECLLTSIKK